MRRVATVLVLVAILLGTVPGASGQTGTPVDAVRAFYSLLAVGQYAPAWSFLSSGYRGLTTYDDWVAGFATTEKIDIETVGAGSADSRVAVSIIVTDSLPAGRVTKRFAGEWEMVKEDGGWKLDIGHIAEVPQGAAASAPPPVAAPAPPRAANPAATLLGKTGRACYSGTTFDVTPEQADWVKVFGKVQADGMWVPLVVAVTNTSTKPQSLYLSFLLKDNRGRTFKMADFPTGAYLAAVRQFGTKDDTDDLQPGVTSRVFVIFDVAPDAQSFDIIPNPLYCG